MTDTNGQIFELCKTILNEALNRDEYVSVRMFPVKFEVTQRGRRKDICDPHGNPMAVYRDIVTITERRVAESGKLEDAICGYIETKDGNGDAKADALKTKYANKWIEIMAPRALYSNARPENVRFRGVGIKVLSPQPRPPVEAPPRGPLPTIETAPPPPKKTERTEDAEPMLPGLDLPPRKAEQKEDDIPLRGKFANSMRRAGLT